MYLILLWPLPEFVVRGHFGTWGPGLYSQEGVIIPKVLLSISWEWLPAWNVSSEILKVEEIWGESYSFKTIMGIQSFSDNMTGSLGYRNLRAYPPMPCFSPGNSWPYSGIINHHCPLGGVTLDVPPACGNPPKKFKKNTTWRIIPVS